MYDSVVTGSAGFIGSHLVDRLVERGDRVLGIDSFDDYYARPAKRANLESALASPRFTLWERDLRTVRLGARLDRDTVVYHLAGQPGVRGSWGSRFARYVENNILASQHLFEDLARARRKNRLVYASSSSVYGVQPEGPMSETALPHPISPYGMTKLAVEHLAEAYRGSNALPITSLRFFSVYGPRQRPDMAFHLFFRAVARGRSIDVNGDGRQRRDFTFVGDIVDGVVAAGERPVESAILNLGAGRPVPLATTIRTIGKITGRQPKLRHRPLPAGDPRATWADVRRASRELRYRPRVSLEEGLTRQWEWQRTAPGGIS